jgi:hypothetical protein
VSSVVVQRVIDRLERKGYARIGDQGSTGVKSLGMNDLREQFERQLTSGGVFKYEKYTHAFVIQELVRV